MPVQKKSGDLLNAPRINIQILYSHLCSNTRWKRYLFKGLNYIWYHFYFYFYFYLKLFETLKIESVNWFWILAKDVLVHFALLLLGKAWILCSLYSLQVHNILKVNHDFNLQRIWEYRN